MPTPSIPLDPSSRLFLDRLDQIDEISTKHPIFLTYDEEDHPHDGSEPPVRRCCFTTIPNPIITEDSHKAAIRRLAKKNAHLVNHLPRQLQVVSFLRPLIPAVARLLIQLMRPMLLLIFLYKTLSWGHFLSNMTPETVGYSHPNMSMYQVLMSNPNDPSVWFTIHLLIFSSLLYSIYYDEMILRDFFGWTTEVKAGFYHNPNDPVMSKIAETKFFNGGYRYDQISTPFLFTGDTRTAIPFALYSPPEIEYHRRWVANEDGEAVAFDISFPTRVNPVTQQLECYHDSTKIAHLALFGLNGGSNEPYILDFANRMNALGHTVAVLITRGFMATPIVNGRTFDGSRNAIGSDLYQVIRSLHVGLGNSTQPDLIPADHIPGSVELAESKLQRKHGSPFTFHSAFVNNPMNRGEALANKWWTTPICVHGWSMGGVVLGKYSVSSGQYSGLLSAVCLAASADATKNINYEYSKRNWQSFLTIAALLNILVPQQHLLSPLGDAKNPISIDEIEKIGCITDFDLNFTIKYHGHSCLEDYYSKLSFALDPGFESLDLPTLVMHADDDPVITVDTLEPAVKAIEEKRINNLFVLVTRGGGHLGFPTTNNPFEARWDYPTQCTRHFAEEIAKLQFTPPASA